MDHSNARAAYQEAFQEWIAQLSPERSRLALTRAERALADPDHEATTIDEALRDVLQQMMIQETLAEMSREGLLDVNVNETGQLEYRLGPSLREDAS